MDSMSFDTSYLEPQYDFLRSSEQDDQRYTSLPRSQTCPVLSSSFLTVDTSQMSFDDGEGEPFSSHSMSPDHFTSSSVSVPSPLTPLEHSAGYHNTLWTRTPINDVWQTSYLDNEQSWLSQGDPTLSATHPYDLQKLQTLDRINEEALVFSLPMQQSVPQHPAQVNFTEATLNLPSTQTEDSLPWKYLTGQTLPQTIVPSAIVQANIPSSPLCEFSPVTPLQHRPHPLLYTSSPLLSIPTSVLRSQHDLEGPNYIARHSRSFEECPPPRLVRTQLRHKNILRRETSSRRKSLPNRSGVDCDAIIPQNEYPCNWPGCVDKDTGKPRRFKRQEHRKRHERTVHQKESMFWCWVVTGGKPCGKGFTRNDNLQSHLKKTHGRKSNNQRNPYVATQDPDSKYHDPKWTGPCNAYGLPVGHPSWPEIQK